MHKDGYTISKEDLLAYKEQMLSRSLSESELSAVAGGQSWGNPDPNATSEDDVVWPLFGDRPVFRK